MTDWTLTDGGGAVSKRHGFSIDDENVFEMAYIEAATWSSTGDDEEPLDSDPRVSEALSQRDVLAPETRERITEDCRSFLEANAGLLREAVARPDYDLGLAGHDFWLSRNGHGAGFFDRGLGDIGSGLQAMARECEEINLYFGDDDLLYLA